MRLIAIGLLIGLLTASASAAEPKLRSIVVESPGGLAAVVLAGPDSGWQVVVSGHADNGQVTDVTRRAKFKTEPQDIVEVSEAGMIRPRADGKAAVIVRVDELETRINVETRNIANPQNLNFTVDVAPLFTRYGCNSGGCHGKTGGQDGFELALLGFEPHLDYDRLVKEGDGYRIDLEKPDDSLLLLKSTLGDKHTGGKRFERDSTPYQMMRRWIAQGAPLKGDSDADVERIEVLPRERLLQHGAQQQLLVLAHLSDGTVRDVTRLSKFESNGDEILDSSEHGVVTAGKQLGVAAIMVRYQTHVDVFRAIVPLGESIEGVPLPKPINFVDELIFEQLRRLGIPASETCDDGTFIRRATIDIAGRLPTPDETTAFVTDADSKKFGRLIDRLLDSDDHADYFAGKWATLLRNRRNSDKDPREPTEAFYKWIRDALRKNQPYDQLVRGVLTATGEVVTSPPVVWYRSANEPSMQLEDVAQLFLGQRIQCARCHHHPLEKWSEQDYYGMAAFFSRLEVTEPKPDKKQKTTPPASVSFKPGRAETEHPKTGESLRPTPLGQTPLDIANESDPREALVDWMTKPENGYFARSLANRYWKHFLGRGLVEPEDDLRATNPPTNPQLLDALADHFVKSGFDLRELTRSICTSRTYRLSSKAEGLNIHDSQNYSRFLPRRLNAEVSLDAIDTVTDMKTRFTGVGADVRAVQLPDNQNGSYYLSTFGRPAGLSVCECERATSATLSQQLHMLNSPEMLEKLKGKRAQNLAKDKRPHEDRIRELFLIAFSREPRDQEMEKLLGHIEERSEEPLRAYADIIFVIINSREFEFNH